jgi:subtilase family serine protease
MITPPLDGHSNGMRNLRLSVAVGIALAGAFAALGLTAPREVALASAAGNSATADCSSLASCYTPRQLEAAYGILPLLERGTNGQGETVVLPELAEPQFRLPVSDIRQDLDQFDKLFHLPAARLRIVTRLTPSASAWLANGEEVLDTEMVHAVAPGAAIVEALVPARSLDNTPNAVTASVAALRLGIPLGSVISISAAGQAGGEHCDTHADMSGLHAALQAAADHRVTVVAASGDIGAVGEPCTVVKGLTGGVPAGQGGQPAGFGAAGARGRWYQSHCQPQHRRIRQ